MKDNLFERWQGLPLDQRAQFVVQSLESLLLDPNKRSVLQSLIGEGLSISDEITSTLLSKIVEDKVKGELQEFFANNIIRQEGYDTLKKLGFSDTRVVIFLLRYGIFMDNRQDGYKAQTARIANTIAYAEGGIRKELNRILSDISMPGASEGAVFNWARQEGIIDPGYIPDIKKS